MKTPRALTLTRIWLILFSIALIASGLTAIFAREGLRLLSPFLPGIDPVGDLAFHVRMVVSGIPSC